MALPTPSKRSGKDPSDASGAGALPPDGLYEILLRLPAKDLCRLRGVCRSWRSLTSDPLFIKDHAGRHTRPFLASTFVDHGEDVSCGVSIVDVSSGDVVKRIHTRDKDVRLQRTYLDRVCMVGGRHPLAVTALDPATGATLGPSRDISVEYEDLLERRYVSMDSCAFAMRGHDPRRQQPCTVEAKARFFDPYKYLKGMIKPGSIAPFNLKTEEWMPTLSGPESVSSYYLGGNKITISRSPEAVEHLSITNLNGFLVIVHLVHRISMDLWFLMDVEKGLWDKKYSIRYRSDYRRAYPLLLLDDERIIFIMQSKDTLISYDPKTDTYTDMFHLQDYRSIGIYTGSLLS